MHFYRLLLACSLFCAGSALADISAFATGPAIKDYGPVAEVPGAAPLPGDARFKVAFDTSKAAEGSKPNRTLETAARFINMHVANGVPVENIEVAVVVHGPAHRDLLHARARSDGNTSAPLIAELLALGVQIHLCGQTASFYDVTVADLLPGIQMSLSAMTSHALLQQQGFTLNPF